MMGTAFLRCPEAQTHRAWADALENLEPDGTMPTRAFTGRLGRAFTTDFVKAVAAPGAPTPAPYPVQRGLTALMKEAGYAKGSDGVYAAAVNRVGYEKPPGVAGDGLEFWGGSFVADPFGQVVAEASRDKEETLIVTCDRKHQETVRRHWPFLRDRRIDAYGAITRRFADE